MVESFEPRNRHPKLRLVWFITLFFMVATCGFLFQWANYRAINVENYDARRTSIFRISKPVRSTWLNQIQNKSQIKNRRWRFENNPFTRTKPAKPQYFMNSSSGSDDLLEPEVVISNIPKKGNPLNWNENEILRKLKRRQGHFPDDAVSLAGSTTGYIKKNAGKNSPDSSTLSISSLEATLRPSLAARLGEPTKPMKSVDSLDLMAARTPKLQTPASKENKLYKGIEQSIWTSSHLLNITDFTWIMNNEGLCDKPSVTNSPEDVPDRLLVILVHSARSHFPARQAFRQTVGSLSTYHNWRIQIVFLLGEGEPKLNQDGEDQETDLIKIEQVEHGDIIMGNFIDSFKNLTYKHMMGYKWVLNFCSRALFILKVNDNVFLDTTVWINWLNFDLKTTMIYDGKSKLPDFNCKIRSNVEPDRAGKFGVSQEQWPMDRYPQYCHRWAYGISLEALKILYSVSNKAKYFWRDDVFATGVLTDIAKRKLQWKPRTKDASKFFSPKSASKSEKLWMVYRKLCKKQEWTDSKWPVFYPITQLKHGENLKTDMMCLWNKTMYDHGMLAKPTDKGIGNARKNEAKTTYTTTKPVSKNTMEVEKNEEVDDTNDDTTSKDKIITNPVTYIPQL